MASWLVYVVFSFSPGSSKTGQKVNLDLPEQQTKPRQNIEPEIPAANLNAESVLKIPFSKLFKTAPVNDIDFDDSGRIWAATEAGLVSIETNKLQAYKKSRGTFPVPQASAVAFDGERLWIGSMFGLIYMDENGRFVKVEQSEQLQTDIINALHWDGNHLWIGTHKGLYYKDHEGELHLISYEVTNRGLKSNWIRDITHFSEWIATSHDAGISLWNLNFKAANPVAWKSLNYSQAGLMRPFRRMVVSSEYLWFTNPQGVHRITTPIKKLFSASMLRFETYNKLHGLPSNNVKGLVSHRTGLWVGTDEGLSRIKEEQVELILPSTGFKHSQIRTIKSNGDILWIGSNNGLQFINMAGG